MRDVADLLASAFADDPLWQALSPRDGALAWLFERRLALLGDRSVVGREQGAPIWHYALIPWDAGASLGGMLAAGLYQAPLRIGVRASLDLYRLARHLGRRVVDGPYDVLEAVAVARERRGQGIMSRVLTERLAGQDRPVVLNTQQPRNVGLYERLGFAVAVDEELRVGRSRLRSWTMVRS